MIDREREVSAFDAERIRLRATEWLIERAEPESWTTDDQRELDAWLGASPAHLLAFWRAEESWNRAGLVAEFRPFPPKSVERRVFNWSVLMKGAAVLAVVGIVAMGATQFSSQPASQIYSTAVGGQKTIMLADGSRIDLNTDSLLVIDQGARQRSVTLEKGEAFFRIKHDVEHPFTVVAAGHRITDIGTAFTVRNTASRVVIALVEGSARVDSMSGPAGLQSKVLKPGDVAVATAETISVTKTAIPELETALSWRRGLLIFRHTTLAEAAAEFNRYNQQKLVIEDASTARMELRGTFRANDASGFAHMAEVVMGVQVEFHDGDIVLHR